MPKSSISPTANAPHGGARAGAGRKPSLDEAQQKRYVHWLAWWEARPGQQPSAYALARRLKKPDSTVRSAANGTRPPSPTLLLELEDGSVGDGYRPLLNS